MRGGKTISAPFGNDFFKRVANGGGIPLGLKAQDHLT
jgi:hypothetical protein